MYEERDELGVTSHVIAVHDVIGSKKKKSIFFFYTSSAAAVAPAQ